jgi:predicted site-specific integrase-resolvase
VTVEEAKELLGISKTTFYRYYRQGLIRTTIHQGKAYVTNQAIEDYYAARDEQGRERQERRRRTAKKRPRRKA